MKLSKKSWMLAAAAAVFAVFIFSNSMKNSAESMAISDTFIGFLSPVLAALESLFGPANWVFLIRKAAHLTEFAILGIFLHGLIRSVGRDTGRSFYGFGYFAALSVAVMDEFIQSFSDRTSAVSDVLIDFTGALIGFGVVALVCFLRHPKSL